MTHVVVNPGVCGFLTDIRVEKLGAKEVKIDVDTGCKMIARLVEDLGETVDPFDLLGLSQGGAPLLEQGRAGTRIHAACPVIAGVAKAVEASCGLAIPRNASIEFVKD
jgi:hypothetical protein